MAARFETRKKSGVLGTALFHCHSKTNPPACLSPGIAFFPHKMGSWQCYLRIPTLRFVCQIGETHFFAFLNIVAEFLPGCQDGGLQGECPKEDLKEIKEGERNRRGMIAGAV